MSAIPRIQALLDTGRYRLTGVREAKPEAGSFGAVAVLAVVERVVDDPDDTIECVYVELKTAQEQLWAKEQLTKV